VSDVTRPRRHNIDAASRRAYERRRRRLLLARTRLALAVGASFLPVGVAADVLGGKERLAARLFGYAALAMLYAVTFTLSRWPPAARRPQALAVGYLLALSGALSYLVSLSPLDLAFMAGTVICVMFGTTLLFPLGAVEQAAVAGSAAAAYLTAAAGHLAPATTANVALTLVVSAALSVVGTVAVDRSRRAAFDERQRVRALAVQRRRLIDIGRDLRSTLDRDAVVERLLGHAARLIPADGVALLLRRTPDRPFACVAARGHPAYDALVGTDCDPAFAARLCADFDHAEVREYAGGPLDDPVARRFNESVGVRRRLLALVGPHDAPAGFLFWLRERPKPFTRPQRLAAQGIADQAHTALAAAVMYDEVRRASRLKSDFVSTMSHELRTPLNVIIGYNQILAESVPDDPEIQRALGAVRRASLELLDLIEATLDLGRLEAGKARLDVEPVDVAALFRELAAETAPIVRAPGVELVWDPGASVTLAADRRKLKTILKNLVGNALKFTLAGHVRVECRADGDRCRFRVVDTGIGIRPEDQAIVFEMFRQADGSDRRRYGGTGLGLYIVRQLTTLLEGELALESTPGIGSTFTVSLPSCPACRAAA
jgi:signal transduction histidine kinase